jgi:hypothetical protein
MNYLTAPRRTSSLVLFEINTRLVVDIKSIHITFTSNFKIESIESAVLRVTCDIMSPMYDHKYYLNFSFLYLFSYFIDLTFDVQSLQLTIDQSGRNNSTLSLSFPLNDHAISSLIVCHLSCHIFYLIFHSHLVLLMILYKQN